MKVVISHPHGNQNTSKVVKMLNKTKILDTFWTTIAFPDFINFYFKKKIYEVEFKNIKIRFLKELCRHIAIFFGFKKLFLNDYSIFSVDSIYKDLDLKVAKYLVKKKNKSITTIYSYEDCALSSFINAKKNNITTIYDLTSPYWRLKKKIMKEELEMHPDWKLSSVEKISKNKCNNKDKEILLSDKIIVASSFSAKSLSLPTVDISKINIIPYGVDCPKIMTINKRRINSKFKIFFVGRPVISKGIHYLIEILNKLEFPWELEIAGSIPEKLHQISIKIDNFFKDDRCKFLGQISNKEVKDKMKNSHVFLFPSLFEGFGQVILESMSCGLPVITTYNTGGADIIANEENGYLTKIRDVEYTRKILNNLYENEELRLDIAKNSYEVSKKYSWEKYEKNLHNCLIRKI